MVISRAEAEEIFHAKKTLVGPFRWISPSKSGRDQSCMECMIEMDSAFPRGVFFRAIAYPRFLETFTFQLDCDRIEARAHITLYRLEVKPLRQHTNKFYGPEEIQGLRIPSGQSHEHNFRDNLTEKGELRDNGCAQARSLDASLLDFATALEFVCAKINVANGSDVPNPPSQGALI